MLNTGHFHIARALRLITALVLLLPVFSINCFSQTNFFDHLTTANGLSGNDVQCTVVDKKGFLWIGTSDGLNRYDGYTVTSISGPHLPGLAADNITSLLSDAQNRLWIGTATGLKLIDTDQKIVTVPFAETLTAPIDQLIETVSSGIVVMSDGYQYRLANNKMPAAKESWEPLRWTNSLIQKNSGNPTDVCLLKNDQYIFTGNGQVIIADYKLQKEIFRMPILYAWSGCSLSGTDELLVASQRGELFRISIGQKKIISNYIPYGYRNKQMSNTSIARVRAGASGNVLIATDFAGLLDFNPASGVSVQYLHNPLSDHSLSTDKLSGIYCGEDGNVFIATHSAGLNIFNSKYYKAHGVTSFVDGKGNITDGYVNDVLEDRRGNIWIATENNLVQWDRTGNASRFFPFVKSIDNLGKRALQVKTVCMDSLGRIWAGIFEGGVALLNNATGKYRLIAGKDTSSPIVALKSEYVHNLITDPSGMIWVCTGTGVFTINALTLKVDTTRHGAVMRALAGQRIEKIWPDKMGNIWFASQLHGAWCYHLQNRSIKNYTMANGLPSNTCYGFAADKSATIYIGTDRGLALMDQSGHFLVFNKSNGLKNDRCESLLEDRTGNIWIANHISMVCYTPGTHTFTAYNEKQGFSNRGFRINAAFASGSGEMFVGNSSGLNYFYPEKLGGLRALNHVNITRADLGDSSVDLMNGSGLPKLAYNNNNINFHFAAIDLTGSRNIAYRYMLRGFDSSWITGTDITAAKYTSLPGGSYTFMVSASAEGIHWTKAQNEIFLIIGRPYWKQWWFYCCIMLLFGGLLFFLFRLTRLRRKEKEQLRLQYERKIASVEMNTLRAQMNPHFIFNSLNSINTLILQNDADNATDYLGKFSRLVRLILDNSRSEWVLLENELKALQLYIELESIRFDNAFAYSISVDPAIARASAVLPPLLIQPYVENAIWHGLMHRKTPGGKINISICKEAQDLLILIEDNGVGRKMAATLKGKKGELHRSHGMTITAERLTIVNDVYKMNSTVTVTDLVDPEKGACGTLVKLKIQYKINADNYRG